MTAENSDRAPYHVNIDIGERAVPGVDNLARFERLSREAQIRGDGPVRDSDGQPVPCMTGDGNPSIVGRLCRECRTRPRGVPGPPSNMCPDCWAPQLVWIGNAWGLANAPGHSMHPVMCQHECHKDEVWIA